jgi:hypothetical protein
VASQPLYFQQTVIRSLQLFLPVAVLCISASIVLYQSEVKTIVNKINSDEAHAISMAAHSVERVVQSIIKDLSYLSSQHELIELISENDHHDNNHIKQHNLSNWITFSQINKSYDQIRWLDEHGQERERVNYNNIKPYRVADTKLQNKAKRYYFVSDRRNTSINF